MDAAEILRCGADVIASALPVAGYEFSIVRAGQSSGGEFAHGELTRDGRKLELHFRHSLGLVRYHLDDVSASHEYYADALGVRDQCKYPGFEGDPFEHVAYDVALDAWVKDFFDGDGSVLRDAAMRESIDTAQRDLEAAARAVGDGRAREEARVRFAAGDYRSSARLLSSVRFPQLLTKAERSMLELSNERANQTVTSRLRRWLRLR